MEWQPTSLLMKPNYMPVTPDTGMYIPCYLVVRRKSIIQAAIKLGGCQIFP